MITLRDGRVGDLFDRRPGMGEKRRAVLDRSWAGVFRERLLDDLPVDELLPHFDDRLGCLLWLGTRGMTQQERAAAFAALHVPADPVILFNVWDAGSALAVARAGARAIATGSASVAGAQGWPDGEAMPRADAMATLARIVATVPDLPVTLDLEGGYGPGAAEVAGSVRLAIRAGAVGCNLEDQVVGGNGLHGIPEQAARLRAARAAAAGEGLGFFLNARTDLFLKAKPEAHDAALVDAALERARAYADAGADGFFAPRLGDPALIARLCTACPLPVNIMMFPGCPPAHDLAGLGVARISHGPFPWRRMMAALEAEARAAIAG